MGQVASEEGSGLSQGDRAQSEVLPQTEAGIRPLNSWARGLRLQHCRDLT